MNPALQKCAKLVFDVPRETTLMLLARFRQESSKRGTEVAATLYSLLETAKLHNVDPAHYLREAVRAADRSEALFPSQLVATPS